jgi:MFS family permease
MYDSLKMDKKENQIQKVAGLNSGLKLLATVIGSLIGGLLVTKLSLDNYIKVIILTIISVFIALIVSLLLKEPKLESDTKSVNSFEILKQGFKLIKNNSSLKRLILLSILATPFINYLLNFYQPYFLEANVPIIWLGISLSIASLLGFFASKFAYKLEDWFGVQIGLLISTILPGLLYILMSIILDTWLAVILFILAFSSMNLQNPIFTDYKNRHIASNIRATTLSMIAMISGLYVAVMGLIFGKLADYSLQNTFLLMGIIIIVSVTLIRIEKRHIVKLETDE